MPQHAEMRVVPFSCHQMYDLVADIEKYPLFLPWCRDARILEKHNGMLMAELCIGYKAFRERFVSRVILEPDSRIITQYEKGPLSHLQNEWKFIPINNPAQDSKKKTKKDIDFPRSHQDSLCEIHFFVDFSFRTSLLNAMIDLFFDHAFCKMVAAFEHRAHNLYNS